MLKELNCLLLLITKLLYWSLFKTSQKYIFCDMSCECPHRLSDKLLKSSCNLRCRCRSSALLRGCVYYVFSPFESSVVFQLSAFSLSAGTACYRVVPCQWWRIIGSFSFCTTFFLNFLINCLSFEHHVLFSGNYARKLHCLR